MTLSKKAWKALEREAWEEAQRVVQAEKNDAPKDWQRWLKKLFPTNFKKTFAEHHAEFWRWVEAIEPDIRPIPFFAIWARGAAKTTSAETAVVRLGAKKARKFCLYVRATQDKANESVSNIAAMLESRAIATHYPALSERKLSKYGFARGWRVDMLRCTSGFSVVGLGLDAAVRGIKIEEVRPDLIILDDVDQQHDTLRTVAKKVGVLTTAILPAGSPDVAILGVQNLIHGVGIFNQIAEGTADFLYQRTVSGPHPAVVGLEYEERVEGGYRITAGVPTWEGQDLAICERQINDWGLTAFLREAQHDLEQLGGPWNHIEFRRCDWAEVPEFIRGAVWVDPAVTSTDESDAMGIQADALGVDDKLYRLYSWEQITTPEDVLERAILKCLELGFTVVGIETDQGGDVWKPTYLWTWDHLKQNGKVSQDAKMPQFKAAKAGAGHGSKAARNQRMLADYEKGRVIHVRGTHGPLERSLKRFPSKPLDLADAAYWGWNDLLAGKFGGTAKAAKIARRDVRRQPRVIQKYATLVYTGDRSFIMQGWHVGPGWSKKLDRDTVVQVVSRHPQHFRMEECV